jgi:hypothetical protein
VEAAHRNAFTIEHDLDAAGGGGHVPDASREQSNVVLVQGAEPKLGQVRAEGDLGEILLAGLAQAGTTVGQGRTVPNPEVGAWLTEALEIWGSPLVRMLSEKTCLYLRPRDLDQRGPISPPHGESEFHCCGPSRGSTRADAWGWQRTNRKFQSRSGS